MKIAVCFKVVPDFDQVVDADWDNFSLSVDLGYVRRIFGCFDESALETALRFRSAREKEGEKTECTAVTAAPLPQSFCKTLFAAGFDRVVDLSGVVSGQYRQSEGGGLPPAPAADVPSAASAPPSAGEFPRNAPLPSSGLNVPAPNSEFFEFRPRHIAAVLGNFLGSAGYDLVLAGRETGWADTGAVPLLLAEILGIPVITGAGEIAPCAGGVEVIRTSGAGRERLRARPPLLVTLGNGPVAALRTATLGERLAASGREAEKPVIAGSGGKAARITGESAGSVQAPRFRREERRKLCRFLQGGADLARSVAELRSEYLAVCRASAQNRIKNHESEFLYSANRRLTLVRGSPDNPQQAPGRPGTMTAAFVLPRMDFSTARLFEDLLAAVREAGDRTEFWLPGVSPNSPAKDLPPARPPIPEAFVRGPSDGGLAGEDGAKDWNIRHIESCLLRLETFYAKRRPGLILFPATPAGHELGVRLSARLNCDYFPETRALLREGNRLFARRKVCGSNLDRDAGIADFPAVLTVAVKKTTGGGRGPRIESPPAEPPDPPGWILEYEQSEAFPANPLETAPLIFAAGRGLGSRAACDRLRRVAGHFGAPLGFSRPAALNGWGEIAEIIGQSGLRTGAELCAAVGVSGAAAFMAGIEPASTLIAVNPDKNAPIFRYADIGIIAGAEEFIAALEGEKGV